MPRAQAGLTRAQRNVLRTLRSLADDQGRVDITMGRLAEEAGYGHRWTVKTVEELRAAGMIEASARRGRRGGTAISTSLQKMGTQCIFDKQRSRPDSATLPDPWRSLPATGVRYLRHRLARHTNAEIAEHYGKRPTTVSWHLARVLRSMRAQTGLHMEDVTAMAVLAIQHGLPPEPLATHARAKTEVTSQG